MAEQLIPLSTPWLVGKEKEYLLECVETGWVAGGPFIGRFEETISDYLGVVDSVAVSSGSAALHVALSMLDVGPGDEVITPSLTFVATTNSITATGARPAFVDSQRETWGMDPAALRQFLEGECIHKDGFGLLDKETGRRVKAVLVVHLYGHPVDMDPVLEVAKQHNIPVIEDATESLGSWYKGTATGILGRIGCLSFNGNKTITSGGGGMIVSQDRELLKKARYLINQARDAGEEFYHSEVGHNYRLSNLHAAVGLAQFERFDEFIAARRVIADLYQAAFSETPGITVVREQSWAKSNYWLSTVTLDPQLYPVSPNQLVGRMAESGIEVRRPFVPNHLLPPYREDRAFGDMVIATDLYETGLNLPSSAWMKPEQVEHVAQTLAGIAQRA
jgi:perosamine synthetase